MKIGFTWGWFIVVALGLIVIGFSLGMIVAGHSDWECREVGAICQ